MKKTYIYIIIAISILFAVNSAKAQYTDISYFMRNIPTSFKMNPAMTPVSKLYINFPTSGINMNFSTSGFAYKDIITRRADDSLKIDVETFYNKLTDNNYFKLGTNIELFGFGFQAGKKNYISFGLDLTLDANINFSKGLIGTLLYGTESSNKESQILDGKLLSLNTFIAPSVSFTRIINDKLTVGLRAKVPFGLANITTEDSKLTLDFNNDKITAMSNFMIRTSIIAGSLNFAGIRSVTENNSNNNNNDTIFNQLDNASDIIKQALKNKGLAFDFGGTYKINKDMLVSFSVQDLGFINWASNVTNVKSKNPNNSYEFNGIGNIDINDDNSISDQLNDITDSLINHLDLETVKGESYTKMLPTKIYAGFTWNFTKTQYLNALYKAAIGSNYFDQYISLYYSLQLERYLNLSLGNTFAFENKWDNISMFNPSLALNLNLYCINIYFGGSLRSSYNLSEITGLNFFVGMNLALGYTNYWEKPIAKNEDSQIPQASGTNAEEPKSDGK